MNGETPTTTTDINSVLNVVAEVTGVQADELRSRDTSRRVLNARKIFMCLANVFTDLRKPQIGEAVNRKYNSVRTALLTAPVLRESDSGFNYNYETAFNRLQSGYNGIWGE